MCNDISYYLQKIFLQETSEEAANQVVSNWDISKVKDISNFDNTVETFSDTLEVTSNSGNIIIGVIIGLLVLGALLIYINNKIGFKNLFLSNNNIIHEEEENASTTYTLDDFNQFIFTTSGEIKKKCEWISRTIQFLESKGKDTSKLYSYYLPELVHILTQSDNISPANKILNQSNENITKVQLNTLQTVIDEIKQMLQEYIDKEMMEVECNASVMKTVSHLD